MTVPSSMVGQITCAVVPWIYFGNQYPVRRKIRLDKICLIDRITIFLSEESIDLIHVILSL